MNAPQRAAAYLNPAFEKQQQAGKNQPARFSARQIGNQQQRQREQSEESGGIEKLHGLT
jgi:hypothetical protein